MQIRHVFKHVQDQFPLLLPTKRHVYINVLSVLQLLGRGPAHAAPTIR
jgi:hypothetical protein